MRWLALACLCACAPLPPSLGDDAGTPTVDAGDAVDAGASAVDAGSSLVDAGQEDAGSTPPDAGLVDAGADGGPTDAGLDAGHLDAGTNDGGWRSALYPETWTPSFTDSQGRFLHDFSYAGFELGQPLPRLATTVTLAPMAGDATAVLQAALDALDGGGVLQLDPGLFRIDGTLTISRPNVVFRGSGAATILAFTKRTGLEYAENVRVGGSPQYGAEWPLTTDTPGRAITIDLGGFDGGGLGVGDDIVLGHVITPSFVDAHGMTGTWTAFNGTWQPIAWRTVTGVDGGAISLDVPLRSALLLRDQASLRRVTHAVHHVGVESLSFTNTIDRTDALAMNQVAVFTFQGVKDAWVRDVHSVTLDGGAHVQSAGVRVLLSKRVTVTDSTIGRAQHRGSGGNGYLFELRQANEVLVRDCVGSDGRHNFIQNWGFGTSGCVFQRVTSRGGTVDGIIPTVGLSEFHHSLATANLIEDSTFDDGFGIVNRGTESTGAGHTGTENVFWNVRGAGRLRSMQWGWGYVIGTQRLTVELRDLFGVADRGAAPVDFTEGLGAGATLTPASLYDDQRARRP